LIDFSNQEKIAETFHNRLWRNK